MATTTNTPQVILFRVKDCFFFIFLRTDLFRVKDCFFFHISTNGILAKLSVLHWRYSKSLIQIIIKNSFHKGLDYFYIMCYFK